MSFSDRHSAYAVAIASGLVFGAGLYVSQMIDPLKVLRFLDIGAIPSGEWDPSLALVIAPAILIMFFAVRFGGRRSRPFLAGRFHLPNLTRIDAPLIGGSALFGIGWGMSGICPGPAIALVGFGPDNLTIFLVAMFAGSALGGIFEPRQRTSEVAS